MKINKHKFCECGCKQVVKNRFVRGHSSRIRNSIPCSEEKKKKISEKLMGHPVSEETREKLREYKGEKSSCFGRLTSDSHRKKISKSQKGVPESEETKKINSESKIFMGIVMTYCNKEKFIKCPYYHKDCKICLFDKKEE